jgi:hypothetical protein
MSYFPTTYTTRVTPDQLNKGEQGIAAASSAAAVAQTAADNAAAALTAQVAANLSTYTPLLGMAADGSVTVPTALLWGIDSTGQPYFDPAGAATGEGAVLQFDPSDGAPVLIPMGV